jgi:uncharacterized protein (TIGR04255 family)
MPFPESPRVVFEQNPIAEVICQLRFPSILEVSASEPAAFQAKLRAEYPLYERQDASAVPKEIADLLAAVPFKAPHDVTHRFSTEDSKRTVALNRDFLAVSESHYIEWDLFSREVERAKAALEDIYQPAFYVRTGLRYRNVIDRAKLGLQGEPWSALLKAPFVGILGAPEVRDQVQQMQSVAVVGLDSYVKGGVAVIRYGVSPTAEGEQQYVVDTDLFTAERHKPGDVAGVLAIFNRLDGNLFRWAIAERLHKALRPR